jgi:hypothetical protein
LSVESPKARVKVETLDLSTDTTSSAIQVRYNTMVSLQLTWTGLDATTSIASVQASNDATNWLTYAGSSENLTDAEGTQIWEISPIASRYIRLNFVAGTNAAGTATLTFEGSYD